MRSTALYIALASFLLACSGTPSFEPELVPRQLPPERVLLEENQGPYLALTKHRVYAIGLDQELAVGSWVEGYADQSWPPTEERSSLLAGRVVELGEDWARLEMLASSGAQRALQWQPRSVAFEALASQTKRLARVGASGRVPLGLSDLVTGEEIYALLPLNIDPKRRLAAQFEGLVRLGDPNEQSAQIIPLMGKKPQQGQLMVLLDSMVKAELSVSIYLPETEEELVEQVEAEIAQLPLALRPEIYLVAEPLDQQQADALLQDTQLDDLRVALVQGDETWRIESQFERVRVDLHGATRTLIPDDPSLELLSRALVVTALQLRAQPALTAFYIEGLLQQPDSWPEAWLSLSPALVDAYSQLWRPDWGLELALILDGIDEQELRETGFERSQQLQLSRLALALQLNNSLPKSEGLSGDLPLSSAPLLLALCTQAARDNRPHAADHWCRLAKQGSLPFEYALLEYERALLEESPELDDARREAAEAASSPMHSKRLLCLENRFRVATQSVPEFTEKDARFIKEIGSFGAPALGFGLLSTAIAHAYHDAALDLGLQAARFAKATGNQRLFMSTLADLEALRLDAGWAPLDGPGWSEYTRLLSTLDQRVLLGRRALGAAASQGEIAAKSDALLLARSLFLSVADPVNLAITDLRLAQLEAATGELERALQLVQRAAQFEGAAKEPALSQLRQQLEEELNSQRQEEETRP